MRNTLLVYPPIDEGYYMSGVNDSPPLGLIVLQNYVKRHLKLDIAIDIIDGEYYTTDEISHIISSKKYDMIALQPMMASYKNTVKLLGIAKEYGLVTVIGGHHATQLYEPIMNNQHNILDYIIIGDGEHAFAGLVKGLEPSELTNIAFYESGKVKLTREENVPLEHGLIDYIEPDVLSQYLRDNGREVERAEKLVSFRTYSHKGCSNRLNSQYCYFCGRADKGVRFKKPEDYVSELKYLSSINTTKYIFEIGDDFLQDSRWLNEVARLLDRDPIRGDVHLKIFARANRITPDVVNILKNLNVDEVAIGFESGSEKILKNINKKASPQDNMRAAELLFGNGIDTIASFVLGLPYEDDNSLQETYYQAMRVRELAMKHLGKLPQEIIANIIEINPGAPAFIKLSNLYANKYENNDDLDVYETQNDYFKMEFNLKNEADLSSFRKRLVHWGNKINQLGRYTYPAGFRKNEVVNSDA